MGDEEFDNFADSLKRADQRYGNLSDPALCISGKLTGLLTRCRDKRNRTKKPARVTIEFVAGGVTACLDDDELGYTWTVVCRNAADIFPALAECLEGTVGVMKKKARSSALRKEKQAEQAETLAMANKLIRENRT